MLVSNAKGTVGLVEALGFSRSLCGGSVRMDLGVLLKVLLLNLRVVLRAQCESSWRAR